MKSSPPEYYRGRLGVRTIKFLLVFLLGSVLTIPLFSQTIVWQEDFTLADGTTVDNGATAWSRDITGTTIVCCNDYFEVRSNAFSGRDLDGEAIWTSESIDISGDGDVSISFTLSESGNMEVDDVVNAFYILNGAPAVQFASHSEDLTAPITLSSPILNGSTLVIEIRVTNNGGQEIFTIDDITVSAVEDLYSIGSGNWDANIWSTSPTGPACGCSPNSSTRVTIQNGDLVSLNVNPAEALSLTIEANAELRWVTGGGTLSFTSAGSLDVASTGFINWDSFNAAVLEINTGGTFTVTSNDVTNGIQVRDIQVLGSGIVNFAGTGSISVDRDFDVGGSGITVNNNMTGSISIGRHLEFQANFLNNSFVNNGELNIANDIVYNHDNCSFTNNDDLNLTDDIRVSNNGDVNNSFTNGAAGTFDLNQIRLGNANGFELNNFGIINMTGQFVNNSIPTNNDFYNQANATWNYGGNNNPDPDVRLHADFTGNTFNYNGTTNSEVFTPDDSYWNLQINGTNNKNVVGDLDINGDLTISSTLNLNSNDVNLAGNLSNTGTISNANNLTLDGATQNITAGGATLNDLSVDGTLTKSFQDDVVVSDLTINSAFSFPASGRSLTIAGNFVNNGSFSAIGETITFNGADNQSISGSSSTTISQLNVNKGGGNMSIESTINIVTELDIQSATVFDADGSGGGSMTLVSNAAGDARINALPVGASITGNFTVQRFLDQIDGPANPNGTGVWRYFSSPVDGANLEQWRSSGLEITGIFSDPSTPMDNDAISNENARSIFTYDATGDQWMEYGDGGTLASHPITNGVGYSAFTYHDSSAPTDLTISVTGTYPADGCIDFVSGFNLIGNPFPSSLDWDLIEADLPAGILATGYWKDNTGDHVTTGNHETRTGGVSTGSFNGIIATGQAFWVESNVTTTFCITSSHFDSGDGTFFKEAEPENVLKIALENEGDKDITAIRFNEQATDGYDNMLDGLKQSNSGINLTSLSPDQTLELAIQSLPVLACGETELALNVTNLDPGNYTFSYSNLASFNFGLSAQLYDSYLDIYSTIGEFETYQFEVTPQTESSAADRFSIKFLNSIDPSIETSSEITCEGSNWTLTIPSPQKGVQYQALLAGEPVSSALTAEEGELVLDVPYELVFDGAEIFVESTLGSCSQLLSSSELVMIQAVPQMPVLLASSDICNEGVATIEVESTAAISFNWYTDDPNQPIQTTLTGQLTTSHLTDNETYYVAAVNENGCESEERLQIEVEVYKLILPTVVSSTTVCQPESITIQVSGGNEGQQYRWYLGAHDIDPIPGENGPRFTTPALTESRSYFVSIADGDCESERLEIAVTVDNHVRPVITQNGNILTSSYDEGNQWYLNELPLEGETGNMLLVNTSGSYTVEANIDNCSVASDQVLVTITSVDDPASAEIILYPNPTRNHIYVSLKEFAALQEWVIVNQIGVEVLQGGNTTLTSSGIDVSALPAGLYNLILDIDGEQKSVAFLKN